VLHARQHGLGRGASVRAYAPADSGRRVGADVKPADSTRRIFSFAVVGRGELLMLLPFKAVLLLERARPKIWRSEQILDLRQTG
jgi:hypothetical protein